MSLVLDLPPELETELTAEAAYLGLPLPEIGTRPEIADSQTHARDLRAQAERRP